MSAIIRSLLDTDLYKFTMLQVVLHQFPQTHSVYLFRCRNLEDTVYPLVEILEDLNHQLDLLCELRFAEDELQYLRSLRFIKSDFVDYLELFQLKRRFIQADEVLAEGERRLQQKLLQLEQYAKEQKESDPPFLVSDFGTRRRYSFEWQKHVVQAFYAVAPKVFRGTSNVLLAKELGISPIGTMAHEFLQAFQALDVRLRNFQKAALEAWVQEYRGDLGIALTDVVGMDAFLRDFDLYFAKLFDGLRHDSGDPYEWGDKAYAHYRKLKIDTKTKMLTFSDGLNLEKAWLLHQYFKDRFQVSFGIGTNLTNDMGQTPLNIVLKLVECNGQSVAKISDSSGKTMTDNETFLAYLRQVFDIEKNEVSV